CARGRWTVATFPDYW
nr:immunoglobulin heavy chain junction region [Macaca mulatta]MOV52378.1 immunoglobulin heavy chain junction region [Macaca mulatta]